MKGLGTFICSQRVKKGIRLSHLARLAGIDHGGLYRIEKRKFGMTLLTFMNIAKALGCKPWQLLKRFEETR